MWNATHAGSLCSYRASPVYPSAVRTRGWITSFLGEENSSEAREKTKKMICKIFMFAACTQPDNSYFFCPFNGNKSIFLQFMRAYRCRKQIGLTHIGIVVGWHYLLAELLSDLACCVKLEEVAVGQRPGACCIFNYHWYHNTEGVRRIEERIRRRRGEGGVGVGRELREGEDPCSLFN